MPNGAQSINLVSEMEQESERNQIWVELDAVNLHEVYYYKYITIATMSCMCWHCHRDVSSNRVKKNAHKLYAYAAYD